MRVICASNMKGGAGKSATTCWLANALAKHSDQKILVIDADNQKTVTNLRRGDLAALDNDLTKFSWDLKTASPEEAETIIEQVFDDESYDIIFVDMPRMTGLEDDSILSLLAMCDSFLIPVKPSRPDVLATADFMATLAELKQIRENEGLPIYVYAFHNFYRNIKENEFLPEFAHEVGISLLNNRIKLKKQFEQYNTYSSLLETSEGREDFLPFLKEFIEKYELEVQLNVPTTK